LASEADLGRVGLGRGGVEPREAMRPGKVEQAAWSRR
jgi:hypothetical protein